jgi:fatty-acid desaturase
VLQPADDTVQYVAYVTNSRIMFVQYVAYVLNSRTMYSGRIEFSIRNSRRKDVNYGWQVL